jgi:hypothetical protein
MYALLLLPLFFPFIGFFPGVDTQPIFLTFAFVMFILLLKRMFFDLKFLIAFILTIACIVFHFMLDSSNLELKYVFTYIGALLTFFLIHNAVYNGLFKLTLNFILIVSSIYIVVGIVQLFIPDFLASVVNRSVEHALTYQTSGRGVRSLTGEPTAFGKVITLLNVLSVFVIYRGDISRKNRAALIVSVVLFIASALLSRSAYALAIHAFMIFNLVFLINKSFFFIFSVILLFLLSSLMSYLHLYSDIRVLNILNQLLTQPDILLQQGAMRRVFNIPISLNNLQYFGYLGAGNSPMFYNAVLPTPIGDLKYMAFNRNLGGIVEFILKFGLLSIPIIFVYFYMCSKILLIKYFVNGKKIRIGIYLVLALLLLAFQDSSPIQPLSWFILIYFYLCRRAPCQGY